MSSFQTNENHTLAGNREVMLYLGNLTTPDYTAKCSLRMVPRLGEVTYCGTAANETWTKKTPEPVRFTFAPEQRDTLLASTHTEISYSTRSKPKSFSELLGDLTSRILDSENTDE